MITHRRPTHGTSGQSHRTLTGTRHQEDNLSKATSSLFLVEMIAKLENTQSYACDSQDSRIRLAGCMLNLLKIHRSLLIISGVLYCHPLEG